MMRSALAAGLIASAFSAVPIIKKGQDGYDDHTRMWNYLPELEGWVPLLQPGVRPDAAEFAVPTTITDVTDIVGHYKHRGLHPRVKSAGGHNYAGWGIEDGGVTISLREMREFAINSGDETVTIGPGYQWHEVYKLLEDDKTCPDVDGHPHQWIIPGGTCKSVGVAGYTLGGGHSSLSRTLGLGIDSLVSMDVVLADGTVAHCSEQSHPDLFWALKGSGGTSFGVVVRFVFRLSKIPRQMAHGKISFNTLWNKPKRSNLLQRYFDFAQTMPPTLNVYSKCNGVVLEFFYSSTEANHEDGMKHIDQFLQLFKWNDFPDMREAEKVGSFWDYEVLVNLDEFDELPASVYWQSALVTEMTSESVDELVEGFGFLYISSLGGAITNYADDATAYRFRSAAFTISAMKAIILKDNVQDAHSNWASFRSKLGSSYLGAYVNYVDPYMMTNFMTEYYGPNAERLSVVKATYDPTNFWRFPQSIPLP